MKNLIFLIVFIPFSGFGQITAPDFTLTDVDGNTFNLYQETDAGKTVVLDFFTTVCGTCIINTPVLENFWQTYGFQGDSLWVWGIESAGVSDSMIRIFEDTYNTTFPAFGTSDDDIVIYIYNITYTPQYLVVCPDRTMKLYQVGSIEDGILACNLTGSNQEEILSGIRIYAFNNEIYVDNNSKAKISGVLEIFDIYNNNFTININLDPFGEYNIPIKNTGIVFCRLTDMSGRILYKAKLFSEH